jgi:hypothetical protein
MTLVRGNVTLDPHVSIATHLLEQYLSAALRCGCALCKREAAWIKRELAARRRAAKASGRL